MDRDYFFRARGLAECNRRRVVFPHGGFSVAPSDRDRGMTLVIERGTQMTATDLRDGADAANVRRDFAVTRFDFIAQDMSFIANVAVWARIEIHRHFPTSA
jgi:hypothetical protein